MTFARHVSRIALFVAGVALLPAAILTCATPAYADEYADLVARAEKGDATLDYTALRMAYANSDGYDPYGMNTHALFSAAWGAFEAKDCTKAVASARAMLAINYVSIPMHFVVADCLKQSGDTEGADREDAIGRGLGISLRDSGDGKSPATAYHVVTLSEEGFILSMLGIEHDRQALLNNDGHKYDLLEGKDEKTGEPRGVYFNIDAIFAGVAKRYGN